MRILAALLLFLQFTSSQSLNDLGITVTTADRQFVFTNKEAGTFQGEVNGPNQGGWQGWFINAEKIVHDYSITVRSGVLDRYTAKTTVFPHQLVRRYPNGITETVTLADSIDVLIVEVNDPFARLSLQPTDNFQKDTAVADPFEHWVRTNNASPIVPTEIVVARRLKRNVVTFAIAAGRSRAILQELAMSSAILSDDLIHRRTERMQRVLDRSMVTTNDRRLNLAIAWATLQMDALIMQQSTGGARTKGIFAGLPWFNNYWGRDSFISLPGATYVIGNFDDARDVLRSYAAFQETDTANSNFGRIPNLATPQSVIYNTADGTPWFVRSLYEYVKYSGDTDFLKEMYPVVVRSIEGTLRYHCDSLGFLTHNDADSWMDAVGPNGPWSPRGDRACDVQALWQQQLSIGMYCAEFFSDFHRAAEWKTYADKVEMNFRTAFVDTVKHLVTDHLKKDGTRSSELRPNQLFTIDMAIPEDVRQNIVRTSLSQLVYEHGVATLAQDDPNFHPYHEAQRFYVKDAAYHNGTVWTWLNGIAVYAATRYDLQDVVFPVTQNCVHQMLERGTVGALSELLDAHPKNGKEPKLSGTFSQAWSLAEFLRSIRQDYLGVSVDVPSLAIRVQPKLPSAITSASFEQRVGEGSVTITYERKNDRFTTTVTPHHLSRPFTIDYLNVLPNGDAVIAPTDLVPDKELRIEHSGSVLSVFVGENKIVEKKNDPKVFLRNFSDKKYFTGQHLALPDTSRSFATLRGPSHPVLPHSLVTSKDRSSKSFMTADDPAGDDTGPTGTYTYPTGAPFVKGCFDLRRVEFRANDSLLFVSLTFSALSDPGWHPEYGFQLTFAAIAVNTGSGTQRDVTANSNYQLPTMQAYDRLILVGGGVRVLDASGNIVCEYIPASEDSSLPIGNARNGTVEFAVPIRYIGTPQPSWRISVLTGAQDDHGGAGIGEFRTVRTDAGEWNGGGKKDPNAPNVYDTLIMNAH